MATSEKRFYYGWVIVAIGFCTMLLVQGSFASSGVLFAALTQEYGWSRATISLPFSVALVGYASLTWLSGRLFDRYGPRRLFPIGALSLGLGLILSAQAQHALASVSDLGGAGRTGPELDWFRSPPDADVVVVPPAAWSGLRAGAQWLQHGHADPRARGPVSGEWLRLAAGLHGARTPRAGFAHASERPLAASLPR